MAVRISGNIFNNVGTAVIAPDWVDIDFVKNVLNGVGEGIRMTPAPSLLATLGLKPDTPASEVEALIKAVRGMKTADEVEAKAQTTGISRWLANGANIATLSTALWTAIKAAL